MTSFDLSAVPIEVRTRRDENGALWLNADDVLHALRAPAAEMVLRASEVEGFMADLYRLTARALQYRADQIDTACIEAATVAAGHGEEKVAQHVDE